MAKHNATPHALVIRGELEHERWAWRKQEQTFAAKPASKAVRARPVKAVKDADAVK
jgi:hypothetical protein